jgi:hypothetical protein
VVLGVLRLNRGDAIGGFVLAGVLALKVQARDSLRTEDREDLAIVRLKEHPARCLINERRDPKRPQSCIDLLLGIVDGCEPITIPRPNTA